MKLVFLIFVIGKLGLFCEDITIYLNPPYAIVKGLYGVKNEGEIPVLMRFPPDASINDIDSIAISQDNKMVKYLPYKGNSIRFFVDFQKGGGEFQIQYRVFLRTNAFVFPFCTFNEVEDTISFCRFTLIYPNSLTNFSASVAFDETLQEKDKIIACKIFENVDPQTNIKLNW